MVLEFPIHLKATKLLLSGDEGFPTSIYLLKKLYINSNNGQALDQKETDGSVILYLTTLGKKTGNAGLQLSKICV